MKRAIALLCFACLITGCTMGLWDSYPVNKQQYVINTQVTDYVVSSFQYKNLKLVSQQGHSGKDLNIPQEGIGFLGEKYVYILTSGAGDLLALNQYASEFPFVSQDSDKAIPLKLLPSSSPQAVGMFEDNYIVKVNKPGNALSEGDIKKLSSLGFSQREGAYTKTITVKGIFFNKSQLTTAVDMPAPLNRKYKVEFYTDEVKSEFSALNLTTDIVFTPLTATADIVVIPLGYAFLALITD